MTIDLGSSTVLLQKTAQNSLAPHPDNLLGKAGITSTPPLTGTGVTSLTLSLVKAVHTEARVDGLLLLDDVSILDELADVLPWRGE